MADRFLKYIGLHFEEIKTNLLHYKNFNEDIFLQTIINCNKVCDDNNVIFNTDTDILRYFIGSYKMNVLREKLYYRNQKVDRIIDDDSTHYDTAEDANEEQYAQLQLIKDDISYKFGLQMADIFIVYYQENISIAELQKRTAIKNLKLKLKNIKAYVLEKYQFNQ